MSEGPPKKKSTEAPKVPGAVSDAEYLRQLREKGGKSYGKKPPDSAIPPTLNEVISSPLTTAEGIYDELIKRVKTTTQPSQPSQPSREWSNTVPFEVLTDVAPGSTSVDIEVASPRKEIPPIVLKALSMLFRKVEVSPDGQHVILKRKFQEPFAISIKDAPRMVSLEAERIRLQKEEETPPSNQDFVDTVPSAVAPDVPKGPSLNDPMIQRKLLDASERNRGELGQLNDKISHRVQTEEINGINQGEEVSGVRRIEHTQEIYDPIVGETADRLKHKSDVLRALSEDVEDATVIEPKTAIEKAEKTTARGAIQSKIENSESAFSKSEISDLVIGDRHAAKTGGFDAAHIEIPKTVDTPKGEGTQSEKTLSMKVGDRELISQYEAALKRFGLEEKIKVAPTVSESKDAKILSSYEAALKRYPNTNPEPKDSSLEIQSNGQKAAESLPQEHRVLRRDEVAEGAKKFEEMQQMLKQQFAKDLNGAIPGVTLEGVNKLDIDLSEIPEVGVDIELPLVQPGKEITDVVSSPTVDIELFPELKENGDATELPIEGQRGEKLELLDYLVRAKEIRDQKRRDAGLNAPNFFDERFEKNFGISYEEIGEIDGFTKLSSGQQVLVYENLKEYAEQGDKGYLGAVWSGIKSVVGSEKEVVISRGARGIDAYRDVLDTLIYAANKGPKVHMENGVPMPDFVGMGYDREHRKEQKAACDVLNRAAHVFARVPIAWQEGKSTSKTITFLKEKILRTESQKRLRTYEAKQQAFEEAKQIFIQQLEATGVPREQIVRKLIEVDGQIHMLRFIETNPEAVALLRNIKDDYLWKGVGNTLASRSLNSEFGSVSRAATAEALKSLSGPLVATSLARAGRWSLSAAEQRERDRRTQIGNALTNTGTRSSIAAHEEVRTPEGLKDMGITVKLERFTEQLSAFPSEEKCTKEQKINRARLFNQLKKLVTFSDDMRRLKRIQFGNKSEAAINATKFFETLARAQIILAEEELSTRAPVSESESRLRRYSRKFTIAVSLAGAATLAGVFAVDEFKTGETTGKLKNWFTSVKSDSPSPSFETARITVVPSSEKSLNQNQLDAQAGHANAEPLEKLEPFPAEEKFSSVKEMAELKEIPTVQNAPIGAGTSALTGEGIPQAEPPVTEALSTRKSPTAAEKAEIRKLFTEKPSVASGPRQLSPEALAELKGLFTEKISALPKPEAFDMVSGEILKRTFLEKTVGDSWSQVSNISIESFMLKTMQEGTGKASGLTQLGKIFREVGKPPYNVTMHRSDSTEIFAKQAFTAIELARKTKLETDTMRELLESTRRIGKK